MDWISVKDKLPDQNEQSEVVFYKKPYEWWAGVYTPENFLGINKRKFEYHQHWGDDEYYEVENVTHWMPLPQPPFKKREI